MKWRCVWRPAAINGHLAQCEKNGTKQYWNQWLCEEHFMRIAKLQGADNAK
jgi:hypothetical protein